MNWLFGPLREGIMTVLIVAGPIIIAASVLGIVIGILQTATQIQDQTAAATIKLITIFIMLIFLGMWMFNYISNFTRNTFGKAFTAVLSDRQTVLPPADKRVRFDGNIRDTGNISPLPSLKPPFQDMNDGEFIVPPPSYPSYSPNSDGFDDMNLPQNANANIPQIPPPSPPIQEPVQKPNPPPIKAPTNKVILKKNPNNSSNNTTTLALKQDDNQINTPQPQPIIKPKLPQTYSNIEKTPDTTVEKLPEPTNKYDVNSTWW